MPSSANDHLRIIIIIIYMVTCTVVGQKWGVSSVAARKFFSGGGEEDPSISPKQQFYPFFHLPLFSHPSPECCLWGRCKLPPPTCYVIGGQDQWRN